MMNIKETKKKQFDKREIEKKLPRMMERKAITY